MTYIEHQFYWKRWHLGWSKDHDPDFGITYLYLFIGPLQLRFYL